MKSPITLVSWISFQWAFVFDKGKIKYLLFHPDQSQVKPVKYSSYWTTIIISCCSGEPDAILDFSLIPSIGLMLPWQGKKSFKRFPQGKEYYFCWWSWPQLMIFCCKETLELERLCWPFQRVQTAVEQELLKETPQTLLMFALEVQTCERHARQPVGEKSRGILSWGMRDPVCESWIDGLLFAISFI